MQQLDKPLVLYVYDALCGWCYGFSPVIKKAAEVFSDDFYFVAVSGGMIVGDSIRPIATMTDYILKAYPRVEETSGVKFGEAYLELVKEGKYVMNSIKPSVALSVFKRFQPFKSIAFASSIQSAHLSEGKDLNKREVYLDLIKPYGIDPEDFVRLANSDEFQEQTAKEIEEVKRIGITGFPTVLIQKGPDIYVLSQGYVNYEEFAARLITAKEQLGNPEG